jgi:hypothetical protein
VAEFKVLTNGLAAEYGRLSGGAVVLVTRSGTNQFHGSAYEFFKNDRLNANDWNSNCRAGPEPSFTTTCSALPRRPGHASQDLQGHG